MVHRSRHPLWRGSCFPLNHGLIPASCTQTSTWAKAPCTLLHTMHHAADKLSLTAPCVMLTVSSNYPNAGLHARRPVQFPARQPSQHFAAAAAAMAYRLHIKQPVSKALKRRVQRRRTRRLCFAPAACPSSVSLLVQLTLHTVHFHGGRVVRNSRPVGSPAAAVGGAEGLPSPWYPCGRQRAHGAGISMCCLHFRDLPLAVMMLYSH